MPGIYQLDRDNDAPAMQFPDWMRAEEIPAPPIEDDDFADDVIICMDCKSRDALLQDVMIGSGVYLKPICDDCFEKLEPTEYAMAD